MTPPTPTPTPPPMPPSLLQHAIDKDGSDDAGVADRVASTTTSASTTSTSSIHGSCIVDEHNVVRGVPSGEYAVISHVWGLAPVPHPVFGATRAALLASAAKARRVEAIVAASPFPVWMDVLSIDQDSDKDISDHVAVMDKIYERSARCFVLCDDALWECLVALWRAVVESESAATPGFWETEGLSAVKELCGRAAKTEYFSRVWTFQELMLSPVVEFVEPVSTRQTEGGKASYLRTELHKRFVELATSFKAAKAVRASQNVVFAHKTFSNLFGGSPKGRTTRPSLTTSFANILTRACSKAQDTLFGAAAVLGISNLLPYKKDSDPTFFVATKLRMAALLIASGFVDLGSYGDPRTVPVSDVDPTATQRFHTFARRTLLAADTWPALVAALRDTLVSCSRNRTTTALDVPASWRTYVLAGDAETPPTAIRLGVRVPARVLTTAQLRMRLAGSLSEAGIAAGVTAGPELDAVFRDSPPTLARIRTPGGLTGVEGGKAGASARGSVYYTHHALVEGTWYSWGYAETAATTGNQRGDADAAEAAVVVPAAASPLSPESSGGTTVVDEDDAAAGGRVLLGVVANRVPVHLVRTAGPFAGDGAEYVFENCERMASVVKNEADAMRPYECNSETFIELIDRVFSADLDKKGGHSDEISVRVI
ncbi:hypothetical protein DFJ73DRAFT_765136 [Zopfochytrium polystomum]|nr:hypothetical protein DFJ73DRAFT_765136 [Zopfochytrium polystomum]